MKTEISKKKKPSKKQVQKKFKIASGIAKGKKRGEKSKKLSDSIDKALYIAARPAITIPKTLISKALEMKNKKAEKKNKKPLIKRGR